MKVKLTTSLSRTESAYTMGQMCLRYVLGSTAPYLAVPTVELLQSWGSTQGRKMPTTCAQSLPLPPEDYFA